MVLVEDAMECEACEPEICVVKSVAVLVILGESALEAKLTAVVAV